VGGSQLGLAQIRELVVHNPNRGSVAGLLAGPNAALGAIIGSATATDRYVAARDSSPN